MWWVTYVWQILGYPFLAGKPPGVPVFGHCSFIAGPEQELTRSFASSNRALKVGSFLGVCADAHPYGI